MMMKKNKKTVNTEKLDDIGAELKTCLKITLCLLALQNGVSVLLLTKE
jgi:hypothetical protein